MDVMSRHVSWSGLFVGAGLAALVQTTAGAADLVAPKVLPAEASTPTSQLIDAIAGIRFASDYNFRGVSQSNRLPSWQTYVELQLIDNLIYAGFASYRVDLPTKPQFELDFTGGIRPKLGPFQFDFGFIYYHYPDERQLVVGGAPFTPRDTDFVEVVGKVAYTYQDVLTVGLNVFHTPNLLGTGADGTYFSGTAKYTFPENMFSIPGNFAISAEFGHYFLGTTLPFLGSVKLPDYNYGNVGISYTYDIFTLDVRYHNTDLNKAQCFTFTGDPRGIATGSGRSNWCGDAVVATLSVDITASKTNIFSPVAVSAPR